MERFRLYLKTLILTVAFLCSYAAQAQVAPSKNVEAGTVNKEINVKNLPKDVVQEKNKEDKQKEDVKKEEAGIKTDVATPKLPAAIEKQGFILKDIVYEGNTVFTKEELDKTAAKYLNNYVTLDDLKAIMNNITEFYNNEGYITSFAYLPAQKIQGGSLKIAVMEGKVTKITVKGNKWERDGYLRNNVLKANGLKEGEVFNVTSLRKSLGKINETDYLKGRVILNKGETPESAEITLDVKDRFPLELRAGWNNQGRELIGKQRAVITLGDENITGYGDRAYASTTFARDTFGLNTDYYLPLGPYGTELRLGYGYTNVEVGKAYKNLGFVGKAHGYSIGLLQPIYEGKTVKYTSDITLDALDAKTLVNKHDPYDQYNLRALRIGLNGIKDDSHGRWISRLETHVGLPMLGATTYETKGGGSSKFCRINPSLIRVQRLPYRTMGIAKISAQFAASRLMGIEQLELGGMNTVRGYREGALYAHSGYYMNWEVRRPIPYLPNYKYLPLKDRIEMAAFYDQGYGSKKFMQSVGGGLRIHLTNHLNANLDLGIPLGVSVDDRSNDAVRFHFNILSDAI